MQEMKAEKELKTLPINTEQFYVNSPPYFQTANNNMDYLKYNERMLNKIYSPQLDYTYFLIQIADEDVNVVAPFINDQNAPVSQNERFSLIRWGSQVDLVLPLDERYDFDLVLDDEMHINAGLDKLVKINFRNDPFQQHQRS